MPEMSHRTVKHLAQKVGRVSPLQIRPDSEERGGAYVTRFDIILNRATCL